MPSANSPADTRSFYVTREPFSDYFVIHVPKPDGSLETEELDVEETYEWFKKRGADMPKLEKGLDHIWNFAKGMIEIEKYMEPRVANPALEPRL